MKQISADLLIISILVAQYALFQLLGKHLNAGLDFLIFNPALIWIVLATILASCRAFVELRLFRSLQRWWVGAIEWAAVLVASNIATCWLDILLHPRESFLTVFGFNLFIVLVPSLIVSTTAYFVTLLVVRKARIKR